MFWSASRLMSKPVRLLARRTDSYVHAHAVLRSPMRLFGAVAGASADSYDAGDDNDGIGNGAGVGSDAGAAADSGHAGTVAFAGTSAGTFAGTPSFYEAIDIADVVRARRLRRIRFILVRCVSVLLIVGAVVVASLPFAMQAHSARRLAETSDSAARTVAGWPYPMAMEELERARAYNRRLAVEGQPVLGEAADPFTTRPAGTAGDADTADDSAPSGGAGLSAADTDANYQGLLDSGAGIMGTVLVPKIGVELPIRHGTSEPVLAVGAGHLYGTSLPVGGTGSHTVVTGASRPGQIVDVHTARRTARRRFHVHQSDGRDAGIRSGPNQRDRTGRRLTVENRARRRPADVDDLHAIRHQHASAASLRASRRNTAARARSGRRARRTRDRTGRARHDHRLHDGRHAVVLHGRAVDAAPTPNHAARFRLAA